MGLKLIDINQVRPGVLLKVVGADYLLATKYMDDEERDSVRLLENSILLVLEEPTYMYKNELYPWSVKVLWNSIVVMICFCDGDHQLRILT